MIHGTRLHILAVLSLSGLLLLGTIGCSRRAVPARNPDTYDPGPGWTLVWSDEFNDGELDTNTWTRQVMPDPFNNELQQYTDDPANSWVEDGNLVIRAIWDGVEHGDNHYTSARIISNPGGQSGTTDADGKTFLYGKVAARIQLPTGKGMWPAFWMLGDNISETGGDTDWPMSGEIDILESGGGGPPDFGHRTVHGTIHHDPTVDNSLGSNRYISGGTLTLPDGELLGEQFRVYEIEWDEEKIVWKLDGVEYGSVSISEASRSEFHQPFYVILNIAVGGWFAVPPDEDTPFPQYMYVDWIRHYDR